jgi:hypothetical protein
MSLIDPDGMTPEPGGTDVESLPVISPAFDLTGCPPWSPRVAGGCAVAFGPLAGGLITYLNLRRIGHPDKAAGVMVATLAATASFFWGVQFIPDTSDGPGFLLNLLGMWLFPYLQQNEFHQWKTAHPEQTTRHWWTSLGWGVTGLAGALLLAVGIEVNAPLRFETYQLANGISLEIPSGWLDDLNAKAGQELEQTLEPQEVLLLASRAQYQFAPPFVVSDYPRILVTKNRDEGTRMEILSFSTRDIAQAEQELPPGESLSLGMVSGRNALILKWPEIDQDGVPIEAQSISVALTDSVVTLTMISAVSERQTWQSVLDRVRSSFRIEEGKSQ